MIDDDAFEAQVSRALHGTARSSAPQYLPAILAATASVPQGRAVVRDDTRTRAPWGRAIAAVVVAMAAGFALVAYLGAPREQRSTIAGSPEPSPRPLAGVMQGVPVEGLEDVYQTGFDRIEIDASGTTLDVYYTAHPVCEGLDRVEVDRDVVPFSVKVYIGDVPGATCGSEQVRYVATVAIPEPVVTGGSHPTISLFDIQGLVTEPCSAADGCRYGMYMVDLEQGRGAWQMWFTGDPAGWMQVGPGAALSLPYDLRFGIVPIAEAGASPYADGAAASIGGCEGTLVAAPRQEAATVRVRFAGDTCTMEVEGQQAFSLARRPAITLPTGAETGCRGIGLVDTHVTGSPTDPELAWLVHGDGTREDVYWADELYARFTPRLEIIRYPPDPDQVIYRDGDPVTVACDGPRLRLDGKPYLGAGSPPPRSTTFPVASPPE